MGTWKLILTIIAFSSAGVPSVTVTTMNLQQEDTCRRLEQKLSGSRSIRPPEWNNGLRDLYVSATAYCELDAFLVQEAPPLPRDRRYGR